MKKVLLGLLMVVLILGVVAAAGFTGYRFGYAQGNRATANGQTSDVRPFDGIGPDRMPMHQFGDRFERGFGQVDFRCEDSASSLLCIDLFG